MRWGGRFVDVAVVRRECTTLARRASPCSASEVRIKEVDDGDEKESSEKIPGI